MGCCQKTVTICGAIQLVLGSIVLFLGILSSIWHTRGFYAAQGIWGGLFIMFVGTIGIYGGLQKNACLHTTFSLLSLINALAICTIVIVFSGLVLDQSDYCQRHCKINQAQRNSHNQSHDQHERCFRNCPFFNTNDEYGPNLALIIVSAITLTAALFSSIVGCCASCRNREERITYTTVWPTNVNQQSDNMNYAEQRMDKINEKWVPPNIVSYLPEERNCPPPPYNEREPLIPSNNEKRSQTYQSMNDSL